MATRYSPTIRRRRLSAELRRLRLAARMTLDDAAKSTELARSTVGNIESGFKKRPQLAEVRALLDAYQVSDPEREQVLDFCRQARERDWRAKYRDVVKGEHVGFEAEASEISTWEPILVPGLLQTPDYVRELAAAAEAHPVDADRLVDSRMRRQEILREDPPEFWAIFDETALMRLADRPNVLRGQVEHLVAMSQEQTITIQITRADRMNPGTGGPFVITEFPDAMDPTIVHLETATDGIYLERPEDITFYRALFNRLRLAALKPGETIDRLRHMID
ncbi:helix-turn-helix domain-containing protein [Streptomonospora wellingtoniae]|uniref:Helix-turn-helix transcriptional regulator n=1 Tax=Streptomonospora wellingtoniae TaxID=3075544 RepID=A0ABU2KU36_9ACTN|nr:helix-turn-helix transcriptional regulator [Streptomonospora sp. DSM 45055]MDT0302799.1 helix-turn-helix transcriptional regulator [Streptomonospora sp. DSM 45055]